MVDTHAHTHSVGGPLNTVRHKPALFAFTLIVLAHWAEHITQAVQIYALGWPVPQAKGALGLWFPWLVTSEIMHYGYALVMLVFLFALRKGFVGRSKTWWTIALGLQFWHHIEHLLLIIQASAGTNLLGKPAPTSIIQLIIPRVELHLFYNTVVFIPMVVAMVLHMRPTAQERAEMQCTCAVGASA
ncbi:hypothetical protein ACFYOT_28855 [Saccharothrix saharensis]|uniref:hypothetical protein n=1 Tax=Saccharothrix saharensis TaxID=571190 RepID=UPI0036C65DEC